ncbi:hypothetical protein FRB91_003655 [Serendipita sp. 411]|nr:hypothetical protein FRB91_003655 [Serendipita sp. 411]
MSDVDSDNEQNATAYPPVVEIDVSQLTPLSPQVISKQATINLGTIGHVAHGKSTVVKAISGVHTVRFKNELVRNITIKLGYANAKVDLIKESAAEEHYKSITAFVKGTVAEKSPIVPISAQLKYNIDAVNEYIVKEIPIPVRDFTSDPRLIVIRSFDVNKPGAEVEDLRGGVAGGSILTGVLRVGQEVEIRPGIVTRDASGAHKCSPIISRIVSLHAEQNHLQFAVPGGLIGVGTLIDPTLCRADRLVGHVLGAPGRLPSIYTELEINLFLLRRLLGVKTDDKKQTKVQKLAKGELLLVNIGSTSCGGRVISVKADLAKIQLTQPACTDVGEKVALSRRIDKHWRLVGWGNIRRGTVLDV